MQNKSVFRYDDKLTEDIVKIHESYTTYIDETFYQKIMHEQVDEESSNSYAVKVVALEVGWILNDKSPGREGMNFMKAISTSDRNDLFELEAIQILIEWLYSRYKYEVVKR
jgi:hypothetical protein